MVKFETDNSKKIFFVYAKGVILASEISDLISSFEEAAKKVDTSQYALIVDAKEQKTIAPDAAPLLERCLKMYVDIPFKKRFSVVLDSAVAMLQVKKVGKENIDPFTMVTSVEEAYSKI
jgi:hypothetical protein